MARKRSLKDAAADQFVEKNQAVSKEEAPVVEKVKTSNAGRKKATVTRKRSLKDAAADQLVEKNKVVPQGTVPVETPPVEPEPLKTPEEKPAEAAAPSAPAREDTDQPLFAAEASKIPEAGEKGFPSLKWLAILLLIGFAGGFFFGVGQAIGPANLAFILIGFVGGYFFGRYYKIF